MNKKIHNIIVQVLGTAAILSGGCIQNDLPYPKIPQNILSIAAKGELSAAKIDSTDFSVKLFLDEEVDIRAVQFTQFTYSPDAKCDKNLLEGTWDLSIPMTVDLTLYQSYQWMISAEQNIETYFTVAAQLGETVIDAVGH